MSEPDKAPRTYADWVTLLDRFRQGDDEVLDAMRGGTIDCTPVVAERWSAQLSDALTVRLKQLSNRLQRTIDRAGADTFTIANALLDARRALGPLRALAALPCVEERLRAHLDGDLARWARETQESLEKSARRIHWDGGRLLKAFRDNPLTPPVSTAIASAETATEDQPPLPHESLPHEPALKPRPIIL